jgi:N-acetylated-alpha-linked acidic dipeptidase
MVMRFADANYLQLDFTDFADTIARYVNEVIKLAGDERDLIAETNRRIREKLYDEVADPTIGLASPKAEPPAPFLNFAPLQNAMARLKESSDNFDAAIRDPGTANRLSSRSLQLSLDDALRRVELAMLSDAGLPRRPWFKHQIYAPGFYTGYGVKTLPAIREAIEEHHWNEAAEQIVVVSNTIERTAAQIDKATAIVKAN